ncbi:DnaJ C-terminal domain-containing protein [Zeaxanthinibacter enoshimensis]|uniref:Curved DNA-binding protein n=1 Tax=Zeaxanthinibacter enoshimensis TaxID=392009 RepID=A0A4R6TQM2_9FLAO|nr:J domain-containing protein [Zeaxanthinibacter enoshimensis]TDQ32756.1 curved DNA-binding protein [Zeaxanthinibacter enoshimensis]
MAHKDYYQELGVSRSASEKEIKKAYRKLATEYHPDKTKGDKAKEERFKAISEAYGVLGNAEKRKQYDTLGSDWEQFQQSGSSYDEFMKMREQRRQYQQQYSGQHAQGDPFGGAYSGGDFSDIFESFFGGGGRQRGRTYARPGADVSGTVSISLNEAYHGTQRMLDVEGKSIKLKIKPGAYSGLQLRAKGKGQKGSQGQAGDLYVNIDVQEHPVYERRGDDLYMNVEVDLFKALLGGKQEIPTISGKVQMNLKAGTQNGQTLRLRGKGMPKYGKAGQYGDLFATLSVKLPQNLTEEQRSILEKLRNTFD